MIKAEEIKQVVDFLLKEKEGCYFKPLKIDNGNNKWGIVIGWGAGFDERKKHHLVMESIVFVLKSHITIVLCNVITILILQCLTIKKQVKSTTQTPNLELILKQKL